jgi:AcrR family transcriptional regulator
MAHQKVLEATLALVAERGIEATSMDAVARESGVSKATIYKHWADKDALLLEMLGYANGLHNRPRFDTGDTRADIVSVLAYRPPDNAIMRDRIMPHLVAYSAQNIEFGNAWRTTVMDPPRRELRHLLRQGIAKGDLSPGIDVETSLVLLLGPMMYWYIFLKRTAYDPHPLAETVVDAFWRAFGLPAHVRNGKRMAKP